MNIQVSFLLMVLCSSVVIMDELMLLDRFRIILLLFICLCMWVIWLLMMLVVVYRVWQLYMFIMKWCSSVWFCRVWVIFGWNCMLYQCFFLLVMVVIGMWLVVVVMVKFGGVMEMWLLWFIQIFSFGLLLWLFRFLNSVFGLIMFILVWLNLCWLVVLVVLFSCVVRVCMLQQMLKIGRLLLNIFCGVVGVFGSVVDFGLLDRMMFLVLNVVILVGLWFQVQILQQMFSLWMWWVISCVYCVLKLRMRILLLWMLVMVFW